MGVEVDYAGYAKKDIETYLKNIRRHYQSMPGAAARAAAEHLHQIRVNARRLRNALSVHKDLFTARELKQWDKSIRRAVEVSSQARDLDVYIHFLNGYARKPRGIPERWVLVSFIAALKKKRRKLQPRIIRALDDLNKRNTLEDITRSLGRPIVADRLLPQAKGSLRGRASRPSGGKKENNPRKIYKVARKKLLRRVRELMVFEPFVYQPRRVQELHQMRIAAKHLRYTLEEFAPIYGSLLPSLIERVISFHRQLGDIHDCDVWTEHLARYAQVKSRSRHEKAVLNKVKRHCLGLRRRTYRAFVRNWSKARAAGRLFPAGNLWPAGGRFFEDMMEYVYAH